MSCARLPCCVLAALCVETSSLCQPGHLRTSPACHPAPAPPRSWFTKLAEAADAVGIPLCASLAVVDEAAGQIVSTQVCNERRWVQQPQKQPVGCSALCLAGGGGGRLCALPGQLVSGPQPQKQPVGCSALCLAGGGLLCALPGQLVSAPPACPNPTKPALSLFLCAELPHQWQGGGGSAARRGRRGGTPGGRHPRGLKAFEHSTPAAQQCAGLWSRQL